MADLLATLGAGWRAMSGWELLAVVLALVYLLAAIRQRVWCWPAAIASAAIYLVLMFEARLYMQSVLQLFYMAMAIYGWRNWRRGSTTGELAGSSWRLRPHLQALLLIALTGVAGGALLAAYSDAAFPYLDALVATGAIVTTWMVARKILQNWHYWFVIDAVSIYLYAAQGLTLTAALFVLYLVLVVIGYGQWRASMDRHD